MSENIRCIEEKAIGPYIEKCLSNIGESPNWLGEEAFRRIYGEEPAGQTRATWHQKAKQWMNNEHVPSIEVLFALSGILGRSLNELLSGQDLPGEEAPRLTLYSAAKANSPALYEQLCMADIEREADEYGKTLLQYVLEFRAERVLSAMLENRLNPVRVYRSCAEDPGGLGEGIPLGDFLPTAAKDEALFSKIYRPEVPWSFGGPKESDGMADPVVRPSRDGVSDLLKQKWGRRLLLREYEQRHCEWIGPANHGGIQGGPYSALPYLHGAFNCALEASLRAGDTSLAEFGLEHNEKLKNYLRSQGIPLGELSIDEYGRMRDHHTLAATLAFLPPKAEEDLKSGPKEVAAAVAELNDSLIGFKR